MKLNFAPRCDSLVIASISRSLPLLLAGWLVAACVLHAEEPLDTLVFGSADSEKAHSVNADHSDIVAGGLGESARRLLPPATENWEGGRVSFTVKVDPERQNYITARLWGDDANPNLLILLCEGRQIGYRHLGDIDVLDFGSDSGSPSFNGRFYFTTTPIPSELTKGKTELHFEIRSNGRIWGYGTNFAQYQKPMTEPTRGLYRIYTHTGGCFVPPAGEKQGTLPATVPVRNEPGAEVLDQLKDRVSREVNKGLNSKNPIGQIQALFLAKAYFVKWTPAYQNPKVAEQISRAADSFFAAYRKDAKIAQADPEMYNSDWIGLGPLAEAVYLLAAPLRGQLDAQIDDGAGGKVVRRAAWSEMFVATRDWHRQHRRQYTNQTMIVDLNIQRANRGISAIDPAHALSETDARHYLYEAVGLIPWLGSDTDHGPQKPLGDNYFQLTPKGLTKELGYVGYYGEVIDWVTQIYDATRPTPGQPGDPKIKAQLEKIAHARAIFRYPALDAQGNRAMRIESVVGWRDEHYPGDVCYGERPTWDASALYAAAATLDPEAVGYAQQVFADNQFFEAMKERMNDKGLRVTAGLLELPDEYALIASQPPSAKRLPMTVGQPDFVFADEEDGVVAVKYGNEVFYSSLYWRARYAVNFLARTHYVLPQIDRIAVVREDVEFEPSGLTYTRPDWINMGFGNGGLRYPGELHSALAGEKLPIAKIPGGGEFKPGTESPYAGRGMFYTLRYGPFLIGMNMSKDKTFALKIPTDAGVVKELTSTPGTAAPGAVQKVAPQTTVVYRLGK